MNESCVAVGVAVAAIGCSWPTALVADSLQAPRAAEVQSAVTAQPAAIEPMEQGTLWRVDRHVCASHCVDGEWRIQVNGAALSELRQGKSVSIELPSASKPYQLVPQGWASQDDSAVAEGLVLGESQGTLLALQTQGFLVLVLLTGSDSFIARLDETTGTGVLLRDKADLAMSADRTTLN